MLRKTIIALTAIAALGGVALLPTAASAGWKGNGHHHHHRHGFGWGFYAGPRYVPTDCYWVKKQTPIGVKLVRVCSTV